jgi:acetyltransferase-like isoleucine patch superfamily enzyme
MGQPEWIGPGAIVEGAELGDGVRVGPYAVIWPGTVLEDDVEVGAFAVVGQEPRRARTSTLAVTELPPLRVGRGSYIGTHAIVYRGSVLGPECFVADGAQVRERCTLGQRVIVGRGATVENDCRVGDFAKLETGAYLTAHSVVEAHVFIAPYVATSNDRYLARTEARHQAIRGPHLKRGARIGVGAVLLPGVTVGQEGVVAAGAVATRDVPPYRVVMGIPAREVRAVPETEWIYRPDAPDSDGEVRSHD